MADPNARYLPILYVRGYAMTKGEQDATAADPFCGFNLGSTVYRATPDKEKPPKKFVFESPVVRLASDFEYKDVYEEGLDILDEGWKGTISRRSIVIFRYYDEASRLLGSGETPPLEDFARDLSKLILRVRELVAQNPKDPVSPADFRCYLVAHSMGGLVCRAFLQNPELGDPAARRCVEKVFTYATPHNGIEMAGVNVPAWLGACDMNNFNRVRMAEYLALQERFKATRRVDWMPEASFPSEKFFCMVGTNRGDYEAAKGLSRTFAGEGSDGLVRIANASVWGFDKGGGLSAPCATAYTFRSHSGFFGIVNGEESYQNLIRFLFGDVRADIWVDVEGVSLPKRIQGKDVDALYQFELLAAPRGKRWYLTRRTAEEDSVACLRHKDLVNEGNFVPKSIYLSTVFLAKRARVNERSPSLAYGMTLGVRVPDYEVDRKFWPNGHYEGGYLFRDTVIVEVTPAGDDGSPWKAAYDWQSKSPVKATRPLTGTKTAAGKTEYIIPFESAATPGIKGRIRLVVSGWNA